MNTPFKNKKQNIEINTSNFHDVSGNPKGGYEKIEIQIMDLLNKMNRSLFNYITGKDQEDEW